MFLDVEFFFWSFAKHVNILDFRSREAHGVMDGEIKIVPPWYATQLDFLFYIFTLFPVSNQSLFSA